MKSSIKSLKKDSSDTRYQLSINNVTMFNIINKQVFIKIRQICSSKLPCNAFQVWCTFLWIPRLAMLSVYTTLIFTSPSPEVYPNSAIPRRNSRPSTARTRRPTSLNSKIIMYLECMVKAQGNNKRRTKIVKLNTRSLTS